MVGLEGGADGEATEKDSPAKAAITIRRLDPLTSERAQVLRLYRANSATLGFFPQGALDEFVDEGCVLVALDDGGLLGYLAYRICADSAKIVHLCVDSEQRGRGVARGLAEELFRETATVQDVRLLCREDYPLTEFWPRLGFVCANEKAGRSKSGKKLFLWVRRNGELPPLLAAIDAASRANKKTAVVDANVFYDFGETDDRSQESKGLLADWLTDDVVICLTAEIKNEISRHPDSEFRIRRRGQVEDFTVLEATADKLKPALTLIETLLPPANGAADESDRRQLAHAIAEEAEFFITRDQTVLDHAESLRVEAAIEVLRPTDFLVRLHSQNGERYAPARLVGTSVTETRASSEAQLASFQRFASSESKARWLQLIRPILTQPQRFETNLVSWQGSAHAAYSVDVTSSSVCIPLLRAHRDPRAPTVLRRILAEILLRAQTNAPATVVCEDVGDPVVHSALEDVGFVLRDGRYEKWTMRAVVDISQVEALVPTLAPQAGSGPDLIERRCWPLKTRGSNIPAYLIPIRPHWAAQLFDSDLASRDLFGARLETALALENVYYSSSMIDIPAGVRVLWYVSDPVQAVRAASISLGTVRAPARLLFRQFSRLGIYSWADLMRKAKGQPDQPLNAYRFAYTERFPRPVPLGEFQAILHQQIGHGNPLAGPVRLSEQVFLDVYRAATGL